ncbi:glycosyltransferase family 2 protein [Candidatus Microgenomates bacterium]|nr:MAG: glycosyltransferase family 2 protein [Candidatus Microgenomates bacterium]
MKLSIIIVSFNTRDVLKDCLTSLFTHHKTEIAKRLFEIIVVDNGSTDETQAMIKKQFPRVKLIQNARNEGFGKANNVAARKTISEYVLFLNPDTIVPVQTLDTLLSYLETHVDVGIVTCKVLLTHGKIDDASHRGFPTPWRALTHFSGLSQLFPRSMFFNGYHLGYQRMDEPHEIDACAGAFLMMRRKVGELVGWFDEDYFWYGEDLDLCFRVKQAGFKIMYVPEVSITHVKGAASGFKKHSKHLAKIDNETRKKLVEARFSVMRTFYKKHYQHKYSWITMQLVLLGIWIKQKITEMTA